MPTPGPGLVRVAAPLLVAGLVGLLVWPGCESATEPPAPEPAPFAFLPAGASARIALGENLEFQVQGEDLHLTVITWTSGKFGTTGGSRLRYPGDAFEDDLVGVVVEKGGRTWEHSWTLDVVPGAGDLLGFTPAVDAPPVFVDLPELFAVQSDWGDFTAAWSVDGTAAGSGPEFEFEAVSTGPVDLRVDVALGDTTLAHAWSLDVRPFAEALPGPVTALAALPGQDRGEVRLAWSTPASSVFPLDYYEMRISATGPVTEENWSELLPLPIVNHEDAKSDYLAVVPRYLSGLVGGEEAWCAVRSRDERGLMSPVENVATMVIDGRWSITGVARDHLGNALPDLEVTSDVGLYATTTAADGSFSIGPFELPEKPVLSTGSPPGGDWHVVRSDSLGAASAREWNPIVIPRWGCDPRCTGFDAHFIMYFRNLTETVNPSSSRPNTRLYRWENYPVSVHVPDFTSPGGVIFHDACRAMVQAWNDNLGDEYLVLEEDPELADVVFAYELDDPGFVGRADMDEPGGGLLTLGTAIPERVTVRLQPTLLSELAVQAVSLHELGHVLGLYGHAYCNEPNYLMWLGGINPFVRPPEESIHVDEIRAVQLIRALPQGIRMVHYPLRDR